MTVYKLLQVFSVAGIMGDFYPIKIFNYESSLGLFQSVSVNYLQLHKCKTFLSLADIHRLLR